MPSTRRTALRWLGTTLGIGTAGCLGVESDATPGRRTTESPSPPTTTTTTTTSRPTATATPTPYPPDALAVEELESVDRSVPSAIEPVDAASDPFTVLAVGDRSQVQSADRKPHQVWVWNDADEPRDIALTLRNSRGTVFVRTLVFEANTRLAVVLRVPSRYEFAVGHADRAKTVEIPFSRFDCNDSATDIVLRTDGSIESGTIATELACTMLTPGAE